MSVKKCMICRRNIPLNDFKSHFVSCRRNLLNENKKITKDGTTIKKRSGCGCGRKRT